MAPETCPNCGASLPRDAKACPECGSDENTGWSDDAFVQSLGLPDDKFSYDEFIQNEFGKKERLKPRGVHWIWWIVGIALVLGFIAMLVSH